MKAFVIINHKTYFVRLYSICSFWEEGGAILGTELGPSYHLKRKVVGLILLCLIQKYEAVIVILGNLGNSKQHYLHCQVMFASCQPFSQTDGITLQVISSSIFKKMLIFH